MIDGVEHVTTGHVLMDKPQWEGAYRAAWELYYSSDHIERIMRRGKASGISTARLANQLLRFSFTFRHEGVHPLQGGFLRRKLRSQRRSGLKRENPVVFYPRRAWEIVATQIRFASALYDCIDCAIASSVIPTPISIVH